jgi:prepilin-type N-terminal cleavage/methylation domain-containing protein
MFTFTQRRGFTLIELLVVLALIALLTSATLAAVNKARVRAYDAQRKADMKRIQSALDLYYDRFGEYPRTPCGWTGPTSPACGATEWIPGLVSGGFMISLPADPQYPKTVGGICNNAWPSMYLYYSSTGQGYSLLSHCPYNSSVANTPSTDPFYDPLRPTHAWKICVGGDCSA